MVGYKKELQDMKTGLEAELARDLQYWERVSYVPEKKIFLTLGCDNLPLASGRRSTVLISRIVWAFSSAYALTKNEHYREMAKVAFRDLADHYLDETYGGAYEGLESDGTPYDTGKRTYTQTYVIYGASEYYRATGDEEGLRLAKEIYRLIEQHVWDPERQVYVANLDRQWNRLPGVLEVDTYLHSTEAYTNLCKVWPDEGLKESMKRILSILIGRFLREDGSLYQMLNPDFTPAGDRSDRFADDAEGSWMILEAAMQLRDPQILDCAGRAAVKMMEHLAQAGEDPVNGGIFDRSYPDGRMDTDKMWWEESESVIGLLYAYRVSGRENLLATALRTWKFIRKWIINPEEEWNWKVTAEGSYLVPEDPSDPLKCPYHSVRLVTHSVPLLEELLK